MPVLIPAVAAAIAYSEVTATLISLGVSTIGASILGAVAAFGVSTLLSSALGLSKGSGGAANPAQTIRAPIASHKLLPGQFRAGGAITFMDTNGGLGIYTNNNFLVLVITMSGRRIKGLDSLYFADTYVQFGSDGYSIAPGPNPDGSIPPNYKGYAQLAVGDGSNHGDATFLSTIASWSTKWTSDCKQYGRAKIALRLQWNSSIWQASGMPNVSALMRGRMLYDPRDTGATLTSSSTGSPSVFTASAAHGLSVGDPAWHKNHAGATYLFNGKTMKFYGEFEVATVPSPTTYTLFGPDFQSLTLATGGTGGTVTKMDWTDNAALLPSDYFCDAIYGLGAIYDQEIPETQLIAAANVCDEYVARAPLTTTFTANTSTNQIDYDFNQNAGAIQNFGQVVLSTTGTLPAPLKAGTVYWFLQAAGVGFGFLCTTLDQAQKGNGIDITSTGSGTHTLQLACTFTINAIAFSTLYLANTSLRIVTGTKVQVASTGTLPGGLSAATDYYAIYLGASNIYNLATSLANARKGIFVALTTVGSGIMTITVSAELRYTANGIIDTSADRKSIIQTLLTACGGYTVPNGVSLPIYPAVYNTPTVTLDEDDLRAGIKLDLLQSGQVSFNSVKGTFYDPMGSFQPTDLPTYQDLGYIAADNGNQIWADFPLPFTNSASMGQRLFKINLERVRRERSLTMPCKLTPFQVGAADVIMADNAMWGLSGDTYEVRNWSFSVYQDPAGNPALGVDISARATDANVFAWSSTDERQPAPPTIPFGLDFAASLYQIMLELGLTTNLQLCLDAADSASYKGAGQIWTDRSGSATNFFLGNTVTGDSSDPVFNGSAGLLTADEYFSSAGSAEFLLDALANPSWLQALHKVGAQFTIFSVIWMPTGEDRIVMFSDIDPTGLSTGISFQTDLEMFGGPSLRLNIAGNSGALFVQTALGEGWHFFAASYDDNSGKFSYSIDGNTASTPGGSFNSSSSNAANLAEIGNSPFLGGAMPNGSRIALLGILTQFCEEARLHQIYNEIWRLRPGYAVLPPPAPGFRFVDVISSNTTNYNAGSKATAAGWNGTDPLIVAITINSGVTVGSTSTAAAFVLPSLPAGSIASLQNNGSIIGKGGNGNTVTGGNGSSGGLALSVAFAIILGNNGTIAGGGGGGGGGGPASDNESRGGGGGAGANVGSGGLGFGASGVPQPSENGAAGTATTGGAANTGSGGIDGGDGGDLGMPGQAGEDNSGSGGGTGGAGGVAGACTSGNSFITWDPVGTRIGTLG